MVELRWIKMFLFLIVGLQFTAVTGQPGLFITVRDGDEVTLSCESVTDQDKCDRTDWGFINSTDTRLELIKRGQIGEDAKVKSDRLSVTANCSLVIKNVKAEDAGRYYCIQYNKAGQQAVASLVHLSVVIMTEHKDSDEVKLSCSVSSFGWCPHAVQWVYEGNDQDVKHMKKSKSYCSATVEFITSHLTEPSKYSELFKCNVKDDFGNVQLFLFIPPSSGRLRFFIVSLDLTAFIIIVVLVYIRTRTKGNKTQISDNAVHDDEDGDEATVTYENAGEPSASIRLH